MGVIGKRIKEIRKEKKLTQTDLSKITGYSQNTISGHELGTRKLHEDDIQNYVKALDVKVQDLFEDYDNQSNEDDSEELRVMYRGMKNMRKEDQQKAIKLFEMIFDDWDDFTKDK